MEPDWTYEAGEWLPGDPTGLAHGTYSEFDLNVQELRVGYTRRGVIVGPWSRWRRPCTYIGHRWKPSNIRDVDHCARCGADRVTFPECPEGAGSSSPPPSG